MQLYDPELAVGTKLERILILVGTERMRQDLLKEQGRFEFTLADDGMTDGQRYYALGEEMGEIARELLSLDGIVETVASHGGLREELIQLAACCVAWSERL